MAMSLAASEQNAVAVHVDCQYCGWHNSEDDHRCCRCGRHLDGNGFRPTRTESHSTLDVETEPDAPSPAVTNSETRPARQRYLFPQRVIPIEETISKRGTRTNRTSPGTGRSTRKPRQQKSQVPAQQSLALPQAIQAGQPQSDVRVEPVKCCEHPVASLVHRIVAAGVDGSMISIGIGIFISIFHGLGGRFEINSATLPVYVGVVVFLTIFYKTLWLLGGMDSPGMYWSGLRLLNFDGHPATRKQRAQRMAGFILSVAAVGVGILWALADEEMLAWHDHISKTFPSPRD